MKCLINKYKPNCLQYLIMNYGYQHLQIKSNSNEFKALKQNKYKFHSNEELSSIAYDEHNKLITEMLSSFT